MRDPLGSEGGFSLFETVIAMAVLVVAIVTLAQLFGIAARSNVTSRHITYATVLAGQKLEELRALDVEAIGTSPLAALSANTPGWVDYLDHWGRALEGQEAPAGTVYVRRWAVDPADHEGAWLVRVLVMRGETERVRLVTVRSRRTL